MNKVLHLTSWYPNPWHKHEGIFVQEQYRVFSQVTDSRMINVQVRSGSKWFEFRYIRYGDNESGYYILTKVKRSKIIELLTTLLLLWVLRKEKVNQFDLLHVHIAYPLLVHYFLWKKLLKVKILISEHWSAYHFNFYMPETTKKLDVIKNIFRQQIPVVTVSTSLLKDIQKFSGTKDFVGYVIPNVVDQDIFNFLNNGELPTTPQFFMVNVWRDIKNPFPLLNAFSNLVASGIVLKLILGGYGQLLEKMQLFIDEKGLSELVEFPGVMNKKGIADTLHRSDAYLFSSEYETFSVACAQALCCGVPLIGPPLSAVKEYADDESMITAQENNVDGWEEAFRQFIERRKSFCRREIAEKAAKYLSTDRTKVKYLQVVDKLLSEKD
jgi:L-malate glycosyltransferase